MGSCNDRQPSASRIPHGRINSRMTSYLKIFVLIDFSLSRRYFPLQPRGAVRHDERGSEGAKPNEREERRAYPRSRPSPALLRCRASECEVSGALRDEAKDPARRNFLSTPFQTLPDHPRGENFQICPPGCSRNFCSQLPEIQNTKISLVRSLTLLLVYIYEGIN